MISAITGRLISVSEHGAVLVIGPMECELLVPSSDVASLSTRIGSDITFHTILYLEGDASRGNLEPRLIGFSTSRDKQFFEKFTTVKGIGTKTALRALSASVAEIASAIESRNARFLTSLDGIGKRTAELIIAELSGKIQKFAVGIPGASAVRPTASSSAYSPDELDAINAMVSLGERRPEAERLLQSVRDADPAIKGSDALLREMLRARSF